MKKLMFILSLCLSILFVGKVAIAAVPDASVVSIETEQTLSKGDSFSAIINVGDGDYLDVTDLAGFQLDISFDPAILEAVQVEEGTFLSDSGETYWLGPDTDNAKGVITGIACVIIGQGGVDGNGTLATITFRAIGTGESYIRLRNLRLSNSGGEVIPTRSLYVKVTVCALWDVNKDGRVDIFDLVVVAQHFGEDITTPLDPNPDVNGNGVVDILDFVLVAQHFGEVYSPAPPSGDIWAVDPQYLPALVKMYNIVEDNPNSEPDFLGTKRLLHKLIFSTRVPKTEVFQNYPNPFNPETWIPYKLAENSEVTIRIYSVTGQLIRLLDLGYREAGIYMTKDAAPCWDGTADTGEHVSSGVYFYSIQAGEYTAIRKMVVVQ